MVRRFRRLVNRLRTRVKRQKDEIISEKSIDKPLPDSPAKADDISEISRNTSTTTIDSIFDLQRGPKSSIDTAPRIELPIDLHSNPFSKATFFPSLQQANTFSSKDYRELDHEKQPFRLMDLPAELRMQILTIHLGTNRILPITFDGENLTRRSYSSYAFSKSAKNATKTAVLTVCHQLHREAEDVLWDGTTFDIRITGSMTNGFGGRCLSQCSQSVTNKLHARLLERMRHAVFDVEVYSFFDELETASDKEIKHQDSVLDLLLNHLRKGRGLKTAELHFDFSECLSHGPDSKKEELVKVDTVFSSFVAFSTDRLLKISSVRMTTEDIAGKGQQQRYVPFNEPESFQALQSNFKDVIDNSIEQCGCDMPCLNNGTMGRLDTSILTNNS